MSIKRVVYCHKDFIKDLESLSKIDSVRKTLRRRILKYCHVNKFAGHRIGDSNLLEDINKRIRAPSLPIIGIKKCKDISISITVAEDKS